MDAKRARWAAMGLVAAVGCAGLALGSEAEPGEEQVLRGDLNRNGIHDFEDVALLAAVLSGAETDLGYDVLDIDGSGRLDQYDLAMLENWAERQAAADADDAEPRRVLRGDLDGDGDIDEADALILMEVVVGLVRPPGGLESADVDGNGVIEIADLIALTEILYGLREPSAPEM